MDSVKGTKHQCNRCNRFFNRSSRLAKHQKKVDSKVCDVCDKMFCNISDLECHRRTLHVGQGVSRESEDSDLDQPICPETSFESEEEYKEEVEKHWNVIRDNRMEGKWVVAINKEIPPDFTFRDLKKMLLEIAAKHGSVFKLNIGFGFMLRKVITGEYRYFYPSSNNLLFDTMITISSRRDVAKFIKKLIDIDLPENYYMKRPSSGWVLAGLPNMSIKAVYLQQCFG